MKIKEIVHDLDLQVLSGQALLEREITGGYTGDLLSDVLANATTGNIWITSQIHQNIIAVASSKELSGIIVVNRRKPEEGTIKKSIEEKIPLLISHLSAYEITGKLYEIGIQ
jgi:serine kinase of HPr protein (carbohydrate metabolism regulator)